MAGEPFFEGLMEAFHFAAGGRVVGGGVDLADPAAAKFVFESVASALPPDMRVVKTMSLSVRVAAGIPWAAQASRNAVRTIASWAPLSHAWKVGSRSRCCLMGCPS